MYRFLLLIFFSIIVSSCGKKNESSDEDIKYIKSTFGIAYDLVYDNSKCLKSSEAILKNQIKSKLFINGEYTLKTLDLREESLIKPTIFLGGEFYRDEFTNKSFMEYTITEPKKFIACSVNGGFKAGSYEAAAISVLKPLQEFSTKFSHLLEPFSISKIDLFIAPKIKEMRVTDKGSVVYEDQEVLINNAYYSGSRKRIVILPQGRETGSLGLNENPFGGIPAWQLPGITIHEYGHHLFSEIVGKRHPTQKLRDHVHKCASLHGADRVQGVLGQNELTLENKITKIFTALNEGFADLISHYSSQGERSFFGIGCMFKSREVNSPFFISGDKKILSNRRLETFFGPSKKFYKSCSEETNYLDPHIIGAIFAHTKYTLLESVFKTDEEKVRFLLNWIKQFKLSNKSVNPNDIISDVSIDFFEYLKEQEDVEKNDCRKFFNSFPTTKFNYCR